MVQINGNKENVTLYITIGNSDDQLTQAEWSEFIMHVWLVLTDIAETIHGVWFSEPSRPYQNACWCVELPSTLERETLGMVLREAARRYRQCAITVAETRTTFIYASDGE